MSNFLTIPINANGLIIDLKMNTVINEAVSVSPFGYKDVYIYSHGWSTDALAALNEYNLFSVELAKRIRELDAVVPSVFPNPPQTSLGVGIHWPSEITEDPASPLNALQLFTFYTMEKRADAVGAHAVYSIIKLMLATRAQQKAPLRFHILGHSFGCKVVCSALQDVAKDVAAGEIALPAGSTFNVVLLQGATDFEDLAPGSCYGLAGSLPSRFLITRSSQDAALNKWYVLAGKLANLFKTPRNALGAVGPGPNTIAGFGTVANVSVAPGFTRAGLAGLAADRVIVADLSPVHTLRIDYEGGVSGHHSDINFLEVYELISGFLFQ
jgi:hypothetical protein